MRQIEGSPEDPFRRELFKIAGSAALLAVIPETLFLKPEPNKKIGLSNLSIVPEAIYHHRDDEIIQMSIQFRTMYDPSAQGFLNLDPKKEGDIWEYGRGIKEAIGRNQPVFLIIEPPDETSQGVTTETWEKYMSSIADAENWKGANFIIGNEVNWVTDPNNPLSPPQNPWNRPEKYAEIFSSAAKVIRKIAPQSKILLYGEAYYGNGEILTRVVQILRREYPEAFALIGGLPVHFYDKASLLPQRIDFYQRMARKLGLPPRIYLTELGKPETDSAGRTLYFSEERYAEHVVEASAVALALVDQGKIEMACWHTAFSVPDPFCHRLILEDEKGKKHRTKGFNQLWEVAQLLHHSVSLEQTRDGIVIVTGISSRGDKTTITWKASPKGEPLDEKPQITFNSLLFRKFFNLKRFPPCSAAEHPGEILNCY